MAHDGGGRELGDGDVEQRAWRHRQRDVQLADRGGERGAGGDERGSQSGTVGTAITALQIGATVTTTSFTNTGLTANTTYRYRVAAVDNAGNQSSQSGQLSVNTLL